MLIIPGSPVRGERTRILGGGSVPTRRLIGIQGQPGTIRFLDFVNREQLFDRRAGFPHHELDVCQATFILGPPTARRSTVKPKPE